MVELLIIADDFTGALDTGAQFAASGIKTKVIIGQSYPLEPVDIIEPVLIIDAETRHLDPKQAFEIVYQIVNLAVEKGVPYLYKKTDSALRGNIGSEIDAMFQAAGKQYLSFIPGWPKMGRVVKDGRLYIHGEPVSQSVFGLDPYEPVKKDKVKDIIEEQTNMQVHEWNMKQGLKDGIFIYDTEIESDIYKIVKQLKEQERLQVMAGCAGLASALAEVLELPKSNKLQYSLSESLLIVCGSMNPITKKQLAFGEAKGFKRIYLTPEQKLKFEFWQTKEGQHQLDVWADYVKGCSMCMLDSNDPDETKETAVYGEKLGLSNENIRTAIANTLGYILKQLVERGVNHTLMVTGGDTLLGFINQTEQNSLRIVEELEAGCVLSELDIEGRIYNIISKSGGFGEEDLFCSIVEYIKGGDNNVRHISFENAEGDL